MTIKSLISRKVPTFGAIVVILTLIMTLITPATAAAPYVVSFGNDEYFVDEGAGVPAIVDVSLDRAFDSEGYVDGIWYDSLMVFYATENGTAENGTNFDMITLPGLYFNGIAFHKGDITQNIEIPIRNDGLYSSPNKYFYVKLVYFCPPAYAVYEEEKAKVTIREASARPTVQFDPSSYTVDEDAGTATVYVTLSNPASEPVVVGYTTADGSALQGVNYTAKSDNVVFPAGSTAAQPITVSITDDAIYGGNTQFSVNLASSVSSGNADVGMQNSAQVTIKEDDGVQYSIPLNVGWNLISIPVVGSNPRESDLINDPSLHVTAVAVFNAATQSYETYTGSALDTDLVMGIDRGYFVYCTSPSTMYVTGVVPADHNIDIATGFNMIGWSNANVITASVLKNRLGPDCTQVARFDSLTQSYVTYTGSALDTNFNVQPTEGYFVYTGSSKELYIGILV